MIREEIRDILKMRRIEYLQSLSRGRMKSLATGWQEALVGCFLNELVLKGIDRLLSTSLQRAKCPLLQLTETRFKIVRRPLPDRLQQPS
jgi:hypothetical protein